MAFFEIRFIPRDGSTRGKYRFHDIVYYESKKSDEVKKEFQVILKTQNVKVNKRSSL